MCWKPFIVKQMLLLVLMAICVCAVQAQTKSQPRWLDRPGFWDSGLSEPWWFESAAQQEIETMKSRWESVNNEIARTDNSLSGDYLTGDTTHGSYIRWAPTTGFVQLHIDHCAALVKGFSYGSVRLTPTSLELITEGGSLPKTSHNHGAHSGPRRFLFVRWRSVPYLVPENEIGDFCDFIAGVGKFNADRFVDELNHYVRMRSEITGSAIDLPIVPPGYERLVKRPIELQITAVGRRAVRRYRVEYDTEPHYESRTTVTINGGSAQGVKLGMQFYVVDSDEEDPVVVTRVGPNSSSGVVIRYVEENKRKHFSQWLDYDRYPSVDVGWQLTTSVLRASELRDPETPSR